MSYCPRPLVSNIAIVSHPTPPPRAPRSNGQTKKLTVGEFQLSAEVNHYVVPSKEPAAYLQAKVLARLSDEMLSLES